jgi:hypothetical protein
MNLGKTLPHFCLSPNLSTLFRTFLSPFPTFYCSGWLYLYVSAGTQCPIDHDRQLKHKKLRQSSKHMEIQCQLSPRSSIPSFSKLLFLSNPAAILEVLLLLPVTPPSGLCGGRSSTQEANCQLLRWEGSRTSLSMAPARQRMQRLDELPVFWIPAA